MVYTVEITLNDGTVQAALFFNENRARKARAVMLFYGHEIR